MNYFFQNMLYWFLVGLFLLRFFSLNLNIASIILNFIILHGLKLII